MITPKGSLVFARVHSGSPRNFDESNSSVVATAGVVLVLGVDAIMDMADPA